MALVDLIVFGGIEDAPDGRLHSERGEVVARHHFHRDQLGLIVVERERDALGHLLAEDLGKRLGSLLIVLVDRIGIRAFAVAAPHVGASLGEHHQGVRILDGQQPQDQLIHQREDRGIRADAQREREHRDQGEQGTPPQGPQSKLEVDEDSAHEVIPARVARVTAIFDKRRIRQIPRGRRSPG